LRVSLPDCGAYNNATPAPTAAPTNAATIKLLPFPVVTSLMVSSLSL
jgi:hypothetical protein